MWLIIGLGNPGPRYLLTRHNVGFRVVDALSARMKVPLYKVGYHAYYGQGKFTGQDVVLAKPMTFMNQSGLAAAALSRAFGVEPARLLVIHDDLDLPPATLRIRPGGGSGGHNGLKSIIFYLGTEAFPRLRIGIGKPEHQDPADYVLEPLAAAELSQLEAVVNEAVQAVFCLVEEGVNTAMNRFNKKSINK